MSPLPIYCSGIYTYYEAVRELVQSPCGKINVIMTMGGGGGGGGGVLVRDVLQLYIVLSAKFSCDYTFLWLNKSRHASSIH